MDPGQESSAPVDQKVHEPAPKLSIVIPAEDIGVVMKDDSPSNADDVKKATLEETAVRDRLRQEYHLLIPPADIEPVHGQVVERNRLRSHDFGKIDLDIMRDIPNLPEDDDYREPGSQRVRYKAKEIRHTREALGEVRDAFETADRICVIIDGPIGDGTIATGFLQSIAEAMNVLGTSDKPLTIFVNEAYGKLFDGFSVEGYEIVKIPHKKGEEQVDTFLNNHQDEPRVLSLNFSLSSLTSRAPEVERVVTKQGQAITRVDNLLIPLLKSYKDLPQGSLRFTRPVENLLLLPRDSLADDDILPRIPQDPFERARMVHELANRCGIDLSKPQIAIIVEASTPEKRYGLENWMRVVQLLHQEFPEYQYDFVYNPKSEVSGYKAEDIKALVVKYKLQDCVNLVHGKLEELAGFFPSTIVTLGNDTGLLHAAAAGESAVPAGYPNAEARKTHVISPTVIMDETMWMWGENQEPVTLEGSEQDSAGFKLQFFLNVAQITNTSEDRKVVNRIQPEKIFHVTRDAIGREKNKGNWAA